MKMNLLELETRIENRHGSISFITNVKSSANATLYVFNDEIANYLKGQCLIKTSDKEHWFSDEASAMVFFKELKEGKN